MQKHPILVIDDDPHSCELLTSILTEAGLDVLTAPDGLSGIQTARAANPAVILLDIIMPGMDGITTCRELKQNPFLRSIPVIGITASANSHYGMEAFRAGAEYFLPKPFGAASLVRMVQQSVRSTDGNTDKRCIPRHHRFRAEIPLRCLIGQEGNASREIAGRTGNVALGGLSVFLPERLDCGTLLSVQLKLPEGTITAEAIVRWHGSQPAGKGWVPHGIQFHGFANDASSVSYKLFLSRIAAASPT
ncbi:MAG: response regulator [Candidatus Methylomirabilales bacterium]